MNVLVIRRFCAVVLLLLPLVVLQPGCGGSGGGNNASGTGSAALSITWPTRSRLIPAAANSIRVTFSQSGTVLADQLIPRPAAGGTSSVTVNNLKVGSVLMTATAYPNADGSGAAQATGSTTISITDNQTANVILTMNSTIDHLEVTNAPLTLPVGGNLQTAVRAIDATGALVLTTPGKITYDSSNHAVATIDSNGLLHGVGGGSSQITIVETESGKQIVVTAGVTTIPAPGNIYITDRDGRVVRMDDMTGANWTQYSAQSGPGVNHVAAPMSVFVDGNHLFMTDATSPAGYLLRMDDMAGSGFTGNVSPLLSNARKVLVDNLGRIYILHGTILSRMDNMTGLNYVTYAGPDVGQPSYWEPVDIALDNLNRVYIADAGSGVKPRIIRIDDMSGTNLVAVNGFQGPGFPQLFTPSSIAVDTSTGRIFIGDAANGRIIRMSDMFGTQVATYGTQGSGVGQFSYPNGISIDGTGRIYISDSGNNRIVRMDNISGAGWTSYGTGGTGVGQFGHLTSIFVR
jgi:hypothetical protein